MTPGVSFDWKEGGSGISSEVACITRWLGHKLSDRTKGREGHVLRRLRKGSLTEAHLSLGLTKCSCDSGKQEKTGTGQEGWVPQ